MGKIKSFEDLECWKLAREFVKLIYRLTRKEKFRRDYDLVSQLRRSTVSVMANIAEGFHRNSNKEFMKFLAYSRSSLAESISHCYVALDQQYIDNEEMQKVKENTDIIGRKLNSFINYLNRDHFNK